MLQKAEKHAFCSMGWGWDAAGCTQPPLKRLWCTTIPQQAADGALRNSCAF